MEINAGYEIIQKFEFPDKPGEPKGQAIVIGKIPNQERYCTWYYNDVGKYNYGIYEFASYEKAYKNMMKRVAKHLLDNNQLQEILTQTLTQTKIIKEIKETANSFLEDAAKSQKGDPSVIRWDGNAIDWLNNAVDVIESILAETEKKIGGIEMSKITKLKPVYHIQTNYGYGWDTECTEKTKEEAEKKLEFYKRKLQNFNKCFARIKIKYEPTEE